MAVIRKGMRVRSIYEPDRVFVVDRSLLPGRVFHEKGATRWYTKRELVPAGKQFKAPKKAAKPVTRAKLRAVRNERSSAFLSTPPLSPKRPYQPKLTCTECGVEFTRGSKARKLKPGERPFCTTAHRVKFWKRQQVPIVIHFSTPKSTDKNLQKGAA